MAIENVEGIVGRLSASLASLVADVESVLEETFEIDEEAALADQIKVIDAIVVKTDKVNNGLYSHYNDIINELSEITVPLREELFELRQRHLEEETDTPREAADNIKLAMERLNMSAEERGLMESALKFLKTLVPPTVEETEEIPFETARVDDARLPIGTEVIEREGVNGEVEVTYEVVGEERTEVAREVIKEPVMELVRVGTKVDEAQ